MRRAALLLLLALIGCGEGIGRADLLDFLVDNSTRKQDAVLRLGAPSNSFEQQRILTWRIARADHGYAVQTDNSRLFVNADFSLVLVFGPDGILQRHALVPLKFRP